MGRIYNIQSLRFVFIMLIVFSHIIDSGFDFGGECGVAFFFTVSGFVLSYAYGRKVNEGCFSRINFIKHQLRKIYPWHLAMAMAFIILGIKTFTTMDILRVALNPTLLQSWVPDASFYFSLNGVSWFLCNIMFCYLLFPTIYRRIMRARTEKLCIATSVIAMAYLAFASNIPEHRVNDILYISPLLRTIDFALGIIIYRITCSGWGNRMKEWILCQSATRLSVIEVLCVIMVIASFFLYQILPTWLRCCFMFWPINLCLLTLFCSSDSGKGIVTRILHSKTALWCGSISLEIFITHLLIIYIITALSRRLSILLA